MTTLEDFKKLDLMIDKITVARLWGTFSADGE